MKASRKIIAVALGLSLGFATGLVGQVVTAAASPSAERSIMEHRQALTQELIAEIDAFRSVLFGLPAEQVLPEHASAILTDATMLAALAPRDTQAATAYGVRAEAVRAAAERMEEAARTGDRAVVLGHLQILSGALAALRSTWVGPAVPTPTVESTVNAD
jgi:hypothetical protein